MEHLYEKLTAYGNSDYYAFHMPGHKRNMELMRARLPYNIDITEIDGFDDLHHAEELLKELQENWKLNCIINPLLLTSIR